MTIATASGAPAPVYFLLHIPRTAGQTIEYHLLEHAAPGTVWLPDAASPAGRLAGRGYRLAGLEDPGRVRALSGHHLGRSLEGRFQGREIRRAVLLRDPLSAALSLYNYRMMNQLNKGLGTHSFALHLRALPRDWMTHFLLSRWLEIPWPLLMLQSDAVKYAAVNQMLRQFWFVGSYTDCDRLIAALAPDLGVPPAATARNSTRQWLRQIYWEPLTEERLAPALRQAVIDENPLDWALWNSWREAGFDPAAAAPARIAAAGRSFFRRELGRPAFVLAREVQRRRPSWLRRGGGLRSGVAKGDVARNAGNWPVAAEHYRRALAEEPRLPAIWVQYGHALKECGAAAAAEDAYRQALKYDAANADAWARLGDLLAQDRPDEAVACLEKAVRCDPEAVGAWRQYASLLADAGDAVGAERAYREAVRLQPADRDSWAQLGHLLMAEARAHEAGECYANAVAAVPVPAELWARYGDALKAAGDLAGAAGAYRRAATLAPRDLDAWLRLADVLARLGRRGEVAECYRKAVAIAPEMASVWVQLGHIRKDDGDLDGAAQAYRAAVQRQPAEAEGWLQLGLVLLRLGKLIKARGCLSRAAELAPEAPAIWVQYGHSLQKLGELDAAERAYRRALTLDPGNADTWVQIGIVWELRWRPLEAAACYVRALALDANLAAIWLQLGHMLRDVGGVNAAIRAYREAVRRDPGNGKMWLHLGNALARTQRLDEAADCRRRAVQLDAALAGAVPCQPEFAMERAVSGNLGSQ